MIVSSTTSFLLFWMHPLHIPVQTMFFSLQLILYLTIVRFIDIKKVYFSQMATFVGKKRLLELERISHQKTFWLSNTLRSWKGKWLPQDHAAKDNFVKKTIHFFFIPNWEAFVVEHKFDPVLSVMWLWSPFYFIEQNLHCNFLVCGHWGLFSRNISVLKL